MIIICCNNVTDWHNCFAILVQYYLLDGDIKCEHGNLARLLRSKVALMPKFLGWLHFHRLLVVTSIYYIVAKFSHCNAVLD